MYSVFYFHDNPYGFFVARVVFRRGARGKKKLTAPVHGWPTHAGKVSALG
jgi:hypothetical protein